MEGGPQPPPMVPQYDQQVQDAEHIRILVIFHYVLAGLTALAACFPIIHLVVGLGMASGRIPVGAPPGGSGPTAPDPVIIGWAFIIVSALIILLGWATAVLLFFSGRSLSERRRYKFVFVMACISCLSVPVGTILGVFTIIVIQRPSVKALFEEQGGNVSSSYSNT